MLKIKSNTNKFTIIFLRRLERKRMLKRSCSASVQFSTPSSFLLLFFFFLFFGQRPFLLQPSFFFSVSALPSALASLLFSSPLFLFFRCVALYFSAQNTFSAQNVFFSSAPLFSSSFFCFILFWFSPLFSLSVPPFFLFFNFVYPRPNILSSCFKSLLFE